MKRPITAWAIWDIEENRLHHVQLQSKKDWGYRVDKRLDKMEWIRVKIVPIAKARKAKP